MPSRLTAMVLAACLLPAAGARAQSSSAPLAGLWTLNTDLSDKPPEDGGRDGRGRSGGDGPGGPGGGGGGRFGGGGGGGFRGGGGGRGGGRAGGSPEDMQRRRDALRDIMTPPARMTITQTDSMVIITTGDGRTTRLSTDGSKIKDESTGMERRTKWDRDHLVSEISGAQGAKLTETYSIDPESHRLMVTVDMAGGRGRNETQHRVYNAEPR